MFLSTFLKLPSSLRISASVYTGASASGFSSDEAREIQRETVYKHGEEEVRETVYKAGWEISASQPGGNQLWASSGKHSRKSYSRPRRQGRLDKSQRLEKALVIS